jgi:SAM-dependent methyltransferase
MSSVHNAALKGYSAEAQRYTQGRPDYPDGLSTWLSHTMNVTPQARVVDLGAGTGKFTRLLTPLSHQVIAIEPVNAMRQAFVQSFPDIEVASGTAQALPLPDSNVDAVLCAQAFHWFAERKALEEIHRVLKPGGRLGLVWNVRDESVDWVAEITRIITPYEGDAPRFHTGQWLTPFDGTLFSPPELTCFGHTHTGTAETVIMNRFLSVSFIASLPAADNEAVTRKLRELIHDHPALAGRETVEFPYQTRAYVCQRLA